MNRSDIKKTPGRLVFNAPSGAISLFSKLGTFIEAKPVSELFPIGTDAHGELDQRQREYYERVTITPEGRITSAIAQALWPYGNPVIGTGIFTDTDRSLVIHGSDGSTETYHAAALEQMPALRFSSTESAVGQATFLCLRKNNTPWSAANSIVSQADSGGTLADAGFTSPALIVTQPYLATWGNISGFADFDTQEGFHVEFQVEFSDDITDALGLVNRRLKTVSARVRCSPIGPTRQQILAAMKVQGTGAGRGKSRIASGADLTIKGEDTNTWFTLKNAILTSPQQWVGVVLTNADGSLTTNQVSTLGVVWYDQPRPVTNDLQGVAVSGNQYVLSGSNGRILTSTNGTNWTVRTTPVNTFLSGLTAFPGGLVAVGQGGVILTSPDAASWTPRTSGTTNWIYRVRHLQNQLIAVGQNGTILTSPDGFSWTARASGTTHWLNDVTWLAGWYYIVGTQGAVLRSTNTIHWQSIGTITEKSLYGIAHADGKLVAVGVEGAIVRSPVVPDLTPIRFLHYARLETNNLFLVAGKPDQRFRLDHSTFFTNWNAGPTLEFLDSSGTLLFLETTGTNAPAAEFYRGELRP